MAKKAAVKKSMQDIKDQCPEWKLKHHIPKELRNLMLIL